MKTRIVIGLLLAAHAGAIAVVATRKPTTHVITRVDRIATTTVLTIPAPPVIVTMPVATPSATDTRACPTPRTDAPRFTPPDLDEQVTGLAVSPTNAGWIAAWNANHVFVSTDAGTSFHRKLDGDGVVHSVQFDCFGHVVAARGDKLGVADGERETWRTVQGIDLRDADEYHYDDVHVIGGGRDLIIFGKQPGETGRARVAVSRDLGATWSYHDMSEYSGGGETAAGVQRADGTILVGTAIPDCMTEEISWIRIAPDGATDAHWMQIYGLFFQFWGDSIMSTYGERKIDAADDVKWAVYPDEKYYGNPIPAPYPVYVSEDKAVRLVGKEARDLPWAIEGEDMQMDPAGRLWSLVCGQPVIAGKKPSGRTCAQ